MNAIWNKDMECMSRRDLITVTGMWSFTTNGWKPPA